MSNATVIHKADEAISRGQPVALATVIFATSAGTPQKPGAKMAVFSDGSSAGTIGGGHYEMVAVQACRKALSARSENVEILVCPYHGRPGEPVCGGEMKVLIEPLMPAKTLWICGAGHIGAALSTLGKLLGFRVVVIDDRKEFADPRRLPDADQVVCGNYAKRIAGLTPSPDTWAVIVTQGHAQDIQALRECLKKDLKYIGVIGSLAKKTVVLKELKKDGIPAGRLKAVDIPVGLDIGAISPSEIAVAIAAGIVQRMNQEHVGTKKFKKGENV